MTLTTERQQFAEKNEMSMDFVNWFFDEKKDSCGNAWFIMAAAMWEGWKGRDNREAQPVEVRRALFTKISNRPADESGNIFYCVAAGEMDLLEAILTAPPAPAVPGIDELRLAFERAERESDNGFNLHKYGIGYADEATQARWESWLSCRAAMLNHVGDANEKAESKCECSSIDYCENCLRAMLAQPVSSGYKLNSPEIPDGWKLVPVEPTTEMINAALAAGAISIRTAYSAMLAAAPEGGNGA
ncbi:hypothetical protein [Serratia marcescens]|uniref:hypothetical protein n=1 Tax=Serratia marcescens TaxID=615 RepID=UPI003AAC8AD2